MLALPDWLPLLLTPRAFTRLTFGLLICLFSMGIVLKRALSLLWLPVRVLGWLLLRAERLDQRRKAPGWVQPTNAARRKLPTRASGCPSPSPRSSGRYRPRWA
jgi:hypothetical protein